MSRPPTAQRAGILILAAGRSRRFGSDKRVARMPDSHCTLLETTIHHAQKSGLPVHVCLREGDSAMAGALSGNGVTPVLCRHADGGMGATLAEAAANIHDWGWSAAIIALGDMPGVQAGTYQALADACSPGAVTVPVYRGSRGNPACFGAAWFDTLTRCDGDRGARDVLASHPNRVIEVAVDDPGILRDVDRPDDLDAMR